MRKIFSGYNVINFVLLLGFFVILSVYVVYEQATSCLSIDMAEQVVRHKNMLAGKSEFYNPWQYRIFSTYVLQGFILIFSKIPYLGQEYIPYYVLRFIQNIIIFFVAYGFYSRIKIESKYLILLGLLLLGYNMSNSVFSSDLSFNTYFDILFYLLAGYLILIDKIWWILILTIIAALNRETSGLIPLVLIFSAIDFKTFKIDKQTNLTVGIISLFLFLLIFSGTRAYYGMPPASGIHGLSSPLDFLKFNLTFYRMYPQLFGTLSILPLFCLIKFRTLNYHLKLFFLVVVPVWFIVHFFKSQAMETRLFLVPQALVFIPATLFIIESELKSLFGNTKAINN